MQELTARSFIRRALFALFVVSLGAGVWLVLSPFLVPIAWAGILAYASWPLYRKLLVGLRNRPNVAALIMTLAMVMAAILPMLWLFIALNTELTVAIGAITKKLTSGGISLPHFITDLPILGADIKLWFYKVTVDPAHFKVSACFTFSC